MSQTGRHLEYCEHCGGYGPDHVHCKHCGASGKKYAFHHGKFCSNACEYRHAGEDLIAAVERTSQFCDTCYGRVRDVEPVPERVHPDADGFQYPTPLTTIGVDDFSADRYRRLERTRWSCRCGAVDPDGGPVAELQRIDMAAVITNLYAALCWLAERDAIDAAPDWSTYADALRERPYQAAYAVGKAVVDRD